MENNIEMKYKRDVVFKYTGEESVPADIKDIVRFDGSNLIIDNKAVCLNWYVAYNKLSDEVLDMDSLVIRSADEWKKKGLFDVGDISDSEDEINESENEAQVNPEDANELIIEPPVTDTENQVTEPEVDNQEENSEEVVTEGSSGSTDHIDE